MVCDKAPYRLESWGVKSIYDPKVLPLSETAFEAMEDKRYDDAIALLSHLTRYCPFDGEVWCKRAYAYSKKASPNFEKARDDFCVAIDKGHKPRHVLTNLAFCYLILDSKQDAIRMYTLAHQSELEKDIFTIALAFCHGFFGNIQRSEELFLEFKHQKPEWFRNFEFYAGIFNMSDEQSCTYIAHGTQLLRTICPSKERAPPYFHVNIIFKLAGLVEYFGPMFERLDPRYHWKQNGDWHSGFDAWMKTLYALREQGLGLADNIHQ